MARIRSVHPGLWTDERFASVSPMARLLFIGIWNECDDAGSFEWSPLKLKMRILPADNADAGALLAELEGAGCIMRYSVDGRELGAVRNFATYQRPKKPNSLYPQTDEVRKYCGHKGDPVPNQLPTSGKIAPQMEDGGGSSSSVPNGTAAAQPDPDKIFWDSAKAYLGPSKASLIGKWVNQHKKPAVIAAISAAQAERAVDPVAFIEGILRKGSATRQQPRIPI